MAGFGLDFVLFVSFVGFVGFVGFVFGGFVFVFVVVTRRG